MDVHHNAPPSTPHWRLALLAAIVLAVCLFYTIAPAYLAPYPGFTWTRDGTIDSLEPCELHPAWCKANQDTLQMGDQLLTIGSLIYADCISTWHEIPFYGYGPGEYVSITFRRDGQEHTVDWQMLGPTGESRTERIVWSLALYSPFWLAGTIILLFLRPRDLRWRLMTAFNYVAAVWIAIGAYSITHIAYSGFLLRAFAWLLLPIYLHLHLAVPSSLLGSRLHRLLPLLYVASIILILLQFLQILPVDAFTLGLLVAFLGSTGILIARLSARSPASDKPAARLMLVGTGLALGPGTILWVVPALLGMPLPTGLTLAIIGFAIPLLPFFYIYALFKHRLGPLEFRANRLLGLYSFILLYACAFTLAFYIGNQLPESPDNLAITELVISASFLIGALPLYGHFQRLIDRLAYGVRYQPDDIIPVFAHRIPTALSLEALTDLLADEIAPSLFIRESAVYLVADKDARLLYARGVSPSETTETASQLDQLMAEAGQYRPQAAGPHGAFDWVRLVIPLETRQRVIGAWLFGRRDPDDYYPQSDVKLLDTLASQVAIALENAQLYAQAHQQVAERERAEQTARESEEMVRALLNATTESVFLLDTQLTILALNQTAARRFGKDVDEFVGLSTGDLVTREILPSEIATFRTAQLDEVIRSGDPVRFEDERAGNIFNTSVYPILDATGNVVQLAIFARDITAQRAAEQQAIHVERLAAVGRLASSLAHEINNPLQAIRANLELTLDFDLEPNERREYLGAIREEIGRLTEISQRMLNLAHQSSDTRSPVPMALLVERALALMREQLQRARIQVTVDLPDDLLPVSVAPDQITQVLLNLAINAVEAMPNGGHLHVAARPYGSMVALTLINDSPPLPPEHIARIFDPFFTTKMDGAGLGLYISRQIIQRHGGMMGVENLENDQGVAFTLTLPRADEA